MNEWYVKISFTQAVKGEFWVLCRVCANQPLHRGATILAFHPTDGHRPRCFDCFHHTHGYGY